MKLFFKLSGILILLMGISLLIYPGLLFGWIEDNMENPSLYIFAIVLRLVIGILFIVASRQSKYPAAIKFIGYIALLAAIIFIFMGQDGFQAFISTLIPEIKPYAPATGLIVVAFGAFLIYAFSDKKK